MSNFKDYATSTVLTAPSPASSGTSLVVQSGHGSRFPTGVFYATVHPDGELPTLDNSEQIRVTSISTDTLTIVRAQGDTTAKSIVAGWRISNIIRAVDPTPIGVIDDFAGTTAPSGWLLCYGQTLDADTNPEYQALYDVIGNSYGGSDNTDFVIPDLRDRVVAGKGNMGGAAANRLTNQSGGLEGDTLGASGGSETHTLTEAQMPSHTHTQNAHNHRIDDGQAVPSFPEGVNATEQHIADGGSGVYVLELNEDTFVSEPTHVENATATNQNTGGDGAHNNVQPTFVLNKIIKY